MQVTTTVTALDRVIAFIKDNQKHIPYDVSVCGSHTKTELFRHLRVISNATGVPYGKVVSSLL